MNTHVANVAHAKKCKEVERLKAEVYVAHAVIDATVLLTQRTRSHKKKATVKDLIKKIKDRADNLKKNKTAEHEDLIKDVGLERKDF
jgi:hypothetical protein